MADAEPSSPRAANFAETLQYRATQSRRARPPNVQTAAGETTRVPLRSDKRLSRRDSRLGLKGIFGRAKAAREVDPTSSYFDTGRPNSIRASLAEISNWPQMRSELALPGSHSRPTSVANNPPFNDFPLQRRPTTSEKSRPHIAPAARPSRGNLATWDPPPLFQAYPQAIKHAQLPAATTSADVILRLTDRKGSVSLRDDLTQLALTPELAEEHRTAERTRKKHLRTLSTVRLEWTSKIYVLCTSGYLLQYTGDGNFDRLPEKVLHLSKDSAAFVSDAIPGKHWVLQVSSVMESNGLSTTDSRSLLARLPFRASDKRHADNFLMVFDSADEMETWISILRREIEALGGKKNLSETGRPRSDDKVAELRIQPSQRTLVVRDPDRFSRFLAPDFSLQLEQARLHEDERRSVTDADMTRDPSIDDISTTNSIISHDGRQLDSLRDSTNRLSYISSGQRTFLTSAGSSPACSPVRDSFVSSHLDDLPPPVQENQNLTARPRPNAAAILDRRQSLQNSGYLELRGSPMSRSQSTYTEADFAHVAANFSVPISRRYSAVKSPCSSPEQARGRDSIPRVARKNPPTALAMARPLSIVADQPSPVQGIEAVEGQAAVLARVLETQERPTSAGDVSGAFPPRQASLGPKEQAVTVTLRTNPRRYASSPSLSKLEEAPLSPELRTFILPSKTPSPPSSCEAARDSPLPLSSTGPRSPAQMATKRYSMHSTLSLSPGSDDMITPLPTSPMVATTSPRAPPRAAPTTSPAPSSKQMLRFDHSRASLSRRSMPQLAEGPPPAPPPSCALPPIPQKLRPGA